MRHCRDPVAPGAAARSPTPAAQHPDSTAVRGATARWRHEQARHSADPPVPVRGHLRHDDRRRLRRCDRGDALMKLTFSFSAGNLTSLSDDELAVLIDTLECVSAAVDDRRYDYRRGACYGDPPGEQVLTQMGEIES